MGAYGDDDAGTNAGAAYLSGTFYLSGADAKVRGRNAEDQFGGGMQMPGDTNHDGYDDVLVSAPQADAGGTSSGTVYLFEDVTEDFVASSTANAILRGGAGHTIGYDIRTSTGDVDADGEIDLLVSSSADDTAATDAGAAWLVYGPLVGTIDIATEYDVRVTGDEASDYAGCSSQIVGDTNNDGYDDLAIGAYAADERGYVDHGAVFLFLGGGM
jgi:hypothetical protein